MKNSYDEFKFNPWRYATNELIISLFIEILKVNNFDDNLYLVYPNKGKSRTILFKTKNDAEIAVGLINNFYKDLNIFLSLSQTFRTKNFTIPN